MSTSLARLLSMAGGLSAGSTTTTVSPSSLPRCGPNTANWGSSAAAATEPSAAGAWPCEWREKALVTAVWSPKSWPRSPPY